MQSQLEGMFAMPVEGPWRDYSSAHVQVGAIINFAAVWLLAPTGAAAAGAGAVTSTGLAQQLLSEHNLLAWGAPGRLPACAGPSTVLTSTALTSTVLVPSKEPWYQLYPPLP